jgi:hypothetical protein
MAQLLPLLPRSLFLESPLNPLLIELVLLPPQDTPLFRYLLCLL